MLHSQAQRLIQQRLRDHVKVDEYNPGKCLRLSYWRYAFFPRYNIWTDDKIQAICRINKIIFFHLRIKLFKEFRRSTGLLGEKVIASENEILPDNKISWRHLIREIGNRCRAELLYLIFAPISFVGITTENFLDRVCIFIVNFIVY